MKSEPNTRLKRRFLGDALTPSINWFSNKKRRVRALVVLMGCICSKGISRDGETHRIKSLKRFLTLSKKGVVVAARVDVASNGNPMVATQDNAVTNSLPPLVGERGKTVAGGGLQRRVTLNAGANRDSSEAVGVPNEVEGSLEIVDVPNGFSGEHVAAGWPSWLTAVAAEAIDGWIPRKASSFEKLDKVGKYLPSFSSVIDVLIFFCFIVCWIYRCFVI